MENDHAVWTLRMPRELHDDFFALARQNDKSGAQVLRELARDYVRRHTQSDQCSERGGNRAT